ncbi:MAG TPA: diguanylate cyclase [Ideonella sp.]|nr:diguanylate cyclase [Ideonella sp.]
MHFLRIFQSLRFRIVSVAALTGVFAAVATATLVLDVTQEEVQRLLLANDRQDRERTAALLASKLETLKLSLAAVARRARPALIQHGPAMTEFLLDQPALGALFDTVLAAKPDGAMLARIEHGVAGTELPNLADRDYFKEVMRSDQPVVSQPVISKVRKTPVVVVAVPILSANGQTQGMLAGTVGLHSTNLFTEPIGTRTDGVRDLVMTRNGTVLSHSDSSRLMGRAQDEPGFAEVFARWEGAGSPIDTQSTAELSQGELITMAGIPLSDWTVVRLTPRSVALAPLRAAQRTAWMAAMAAGLVAALGAGVVAWAAVRPISRLRDSATRMLAGDDASSVDWAQGAGEIGAMSRAFQLLMQQREQRRNETHDLMRQMQAVLDNADVGIALTRNGRFEMLSRQFCSIFQYDVGYAEGQPSRIMYPTDESYAALSQRAHPAFMQHGMFDGEVELMRRNGETFWAHMRGRDVVAGDRASGTIWVINDVTQAHDQRERLTWAASHDRLTGLANRASFEVLLEEATARAIEQPFCALFIDLDRFKQVNDSGGHAAGDALLRGIARELALHLRKSDTVARLGGDEFGVLLPQCPIPRARVIAHTLRAAVESYRLEWEGAAYAVGASIGLVASNGTHASGADVMRAADAACYEAKRLGRNRVETA